MTAEHENIRVVVCDDVPELRRILREVLEDDPGVEVVGEADNGHYGLRLVQEVRPQVVMIDLSMPEMDGLELIRAVAERSPATGIIVLSGFAADPMRAMTIEMGADRYVEKGQSLDAITEAVREVARSRATRSA